jgi:hypothetical protein
MAVAELTSKEERCYYCGKLHPVEEMKLETIRVNGWEITKLFCDENCASYAQMGAEG